MNNPIRIIDVDFNLIAEIDEYESFIYSRMFYEVGMFKILINVNLNNALELKAGRIIFLKDSPTKAGIIRNRSFSLDKDGKGTEVLEVTGVSLQYFAQDRKTIPPPGQSNLEFNNEFEETIMKGIVDANIVNPLDSNRIFPSTSIALDQTRGIQISDKTRYKTTSEELYRIGLGAALGWNFELNLSTKEFIFDVKKGIDRTAGQSINNRAIFSPDFDNIEVQSYNETRSNYFNVVYVAGQGEGALREIVEVGTHSGFERIETFVDARNLTTVSELNTRGEQKLAELDVVNSFSTEILSDTNLIYEKDYDLGDIVTIQNKKWNITLDAQITEITEIYEVGRPIKIEAVFGNKIPDIIDVNNSRFSNIEIESTR